MKATLLRVKPNAVDIFVLMKYFGFLYLQGSRAIITGGSRGRGPNGTEFFRFRLHFRQKAPTLEVGIPSGVGAPNGKSWIRS